MKRYIPGTLIVALSSGLMGVFLSIWICGALIEPNRLILGGEILLSLGTLVYGVALVARDIRREANLLRGRRKLAERCSDETAPEPRPRHHQKRL